MANEFKICPRCKTTALLLARSCANCGHQYRTNFADPPPAPAPRPETEISPVSTEALPTPKLKPVVKTEPPTPIAADFRLAEYGRQLVNTNLIQLLGWLFSPGLLGIPMIIYGVVHRNNLRRAVAEMGIDPQAWERSLYPKSSGRQVLIITLIATIVVVGGLAWAGVFNAAPQPAPSQPVPEMLESPSGYTGPGVQ